MSAANYFMPAPVFGRTKQPDQAPSSAQIDKGHRLADAQDDLAAAEKQMNDCGYHRRDEELADAMCAIRGQ